MKKYFLSAILSAAVLFASCGVGNEDLSGNAEVSETTSVTSQTTETTSEMQTPETITEPQTNETTSETIAKASLSLPKDQDKFIQESPISDYYDGINYIKIPLSYEGKEIYLDNTCHEVINGLEYEDFPAKEDIAPAIEFAFENYFKDAMVCYMDGDPKGEPCTIDCLSFDTGLYLDFDGDGENESLIVIKTDSEAPFTIDSTVVYSDKENGLLLLDENIDYNHYKFVYLYGLVYDECVNLIIEDQPGNTMLTTLYTYNDGFDTAWVNKAIRSDGAIISCQAGYGDYLAPIRLIWDPDKKEYKGIGREKISYKKLIEEIPEMELLCAEIERYYGKEIDSIETAGGLNFYFNFDVPESVTLEYSDGEYVIQYSGFTVAAYIEDGIIKADITFRRYDYDGYYEEIAEHHDDIDNDIAYGLFLTYAVPAE